MLQRLRHHSLIQGSICDPCDGRHNTGDVVSELICRHRVLHARFLSSTTYRCDLCVRCLIKHIDTVSETSFVNTLRHVTVQKITSHAECVYATFSSNSAKRS